MDFNPLKMPMSLLDVPICTQGMQQTWWPEAGTIIVIEPYCDNHDHNGAYHHACNKHYEHFIFENCTQTSFVY